MHPICSILILSTFTTLLLTGCSDNDNDQEKVTAEHSSKSEIQVSAVPAVADMASSAAATKETEIDTTVAEDKDKAAKPKTNPYLSLQYKRNKDNKSTIQEKQQPRLQSPVVIDKSTSEDEFYVCPMHPSVVSGHEGNCPICGMHLLKQKMQGASVDEPGSVRLSSGVVQKIGVRTTAVVVGKLRKSLKTGGNVGYNEERLTTVISKTYGWVENLSLRRAGLMVKQGELLMELYAPEYLKVQKDYLQAQHIDKSAGQLKKYAEREETVPSRDYMRYLDVPESAINELTRTGNSRLRIPVYAPQFGTVIRFNVRKNDYVRADEPMLTIADLSSVWIEVDVFQDQLAWLRRNQKAEVVVDVLPGERLEGRVDYISPELDQRTRTVKARLIVANPDFILRPNMYAQVTIFDDAQQDILKIPREALIETGDRTSVIKSLGDGLFMPVDVVAGFRSDGEVEIKSGLHEGDLVVTSGQFLIDSEANLRASFRRLGHSHEALPDQHAED
jgi:membrane fusion protein, copper/silver efflux system